VKRTFTHEVFLPHRPEDVWIAMTDRGALAEWLMPNDFSPVVGHKFRFQVDGNFLFSGINECEVLEVDPPRRLVYTWTPVTKKYDPLGPPAMTLTWTLTPERDGTRLKLVQEGLENIPWIFRGMMKMGWPRYMGRMMPMVLQNVSNGTFTRGAVPRRMRCYGMKKLPDSLTK